MMRFFAEFILEQSEGLRMTAKLSVLNFEFVSDFDIQISDFMFILSFIFALLLYVYDRPFYE